MGKDFLKIIVENKRQEVEDAIKLMPETELRRKAEKRAEKKINYRSFFKNLKTPGPSGVNIIAEIKRASPSKGEICIDLNPAAYAKLYEKGGASAISVLTDQQYFKGSIQDLQTARAACSLPVLRKEFIISPYQIYESAAIGADAVLLIVRILSKEELMDFLSLCAELHMDTIVEINSEDDLKTIAETTAKLIGINNRNLSSFETNIDTAIRLHSRLQKDQVAVAASGISNRKNIDDNLNAGIFNFLIGESLVRADNTVHFLNKLLGK